MCDVWPTTSLSRTLNVDAKLSKLAEGSVDGGCERNRLC